MTEQRSATAGGDVEEAQVKREQQSTGRHPIRWTIDGIRKKKKKKPQRERADSQRVKEHCQLQARTSRGRTAAAKRPKDPRSWTTTTTAPKAKADGHGCIPGHGRDEEHGGASVLRVWDGPDMYEEKNIDNVIQFKCKPRGTVGTSDRSRASGVGYSTDHAVYSQEEQGWIGHEPE